ncbi:unnamed protein product [Rotaria sordida]|uniref:Uncharacterized protein n=1 Tax=Rotaria sordida TaxID=392033 RepID=A0A814YIV1_9BILA|nr:unnamed protein product [Rotaria sordida]
MLPAMNKRYYFVTALVGVIALGVGIVIGYFVIKKQQTPDTWKYDRLTRQADKKNYQTFIDSVQAANIEANLKDLTSRPHLAGLPEDLESAEVVAERWKNDGLLVIKPKYNVLLSYPDDNNLNRVTLTSDDGSIIIQTNGTEKVYDSTQPKTVNPFLAHTPNGTVNSTKLFYGNYGALEDLQKLASVVGNASLQGSIIIMRYGSIFRGDKIMHAQYFGAIGAILYNDPADYAPFGTTADQVYDQKWYMPPSGAQRGSALSLDGDPLTPIYPSTDYMYRLKEENVKYLPRIPAQPIAYAEAQIILQYLGGNEVPVEWRGALQNVTYCYGGELYNGSTIEVKTYNRLQRKDTYDVIGIMEGDIEPDRYIVMGNHRDAWSLGAIDPTSGTATMLEITRVLGEMYKNGFRPRRSLMFCSWGAEEYGLIGSMEYVQVPSAYDAPGQTVYDKWMRVNRNNITDEPKLTYDRGSGSDYFSFDQLVGSSNMDARYTYNSAEQRNIASHPLYHTSYEVFSMMKKFVDPDFTAHRTMGQFIGVLVLLLSETPVLQFNVTRYTTALMQAMNNLKPNDPTVLDPLRNAINDFGKTAEDFVARSKLMDRENPYEIRFYNDQLLQLERSFLNPLGQGGDYTDFKHIVFAPSKDNQYAASGFPTISDAIFNNNQTEIEYQVAIATYFVRGALSILKDFNNFFS